MADNSDLSSKPTTVNASFNFFSAPGQPKLNDLSLLLGVSKDTSSCTVPVTDLRSLSKPLSSYKHETHGFQILNQEVPINSSNESVHDPKYFVSNYYPAMTSFLKKEFGLRSAAVVNHLLRDITVKDIMTGDMQEIRAKGLAAPFFISHSDYTAPGARGHLRAMTPDWVEGSQTEEERSEFMALRAEIIAAEDAAIAKAGLEPGDGDVKSGKGGHWEWDGKNYEGPRYAIFSIWRPWETVKRDPLALCLSEKEEDLEYAILPRTYTDREGYVKEYYSENPIVRLPAKGEEGKQKWSYLSEQKPEEVYAIKLFDSEALKDEKVRLMVPHSAFQLEGTEDAPARRSCELRVWCIW